jgi:hypothetical protein
MWMMSEKGEGARRERRSENGTGNIFSMRI